MMTFLRSQSQTVLVVVLGVIGLGFLFYGNSGNLLTSSGGRGSNDFGRINGQDVSLAELTDAIRNTRTTIQLGANAQKLNQPGAQKQVVEEAWRELLFLREADRLHIEVSNQELVDAIHNMQLFQKDGVYSPTVYQERLTEIQNAFHLSPDEFLKLMRDNLRLGAVISALFSNIHASARDVSAQYEKYFGPVTVSYISFDPKSFIAAAQVTPDEVAAEYKAHPENPAYRTKEKRKVDYVLFQLSPEQTKLADKEKAAAKDALGEKALDFVLAFQPEPSATGETAPPSLDFTAEAKKRGLTPVTTDFFTADTPPANVPPSPSFNSAAFATTKENPVSKVIELDNGVAVLHLVDIQPSDLRPLDEVKDDIAKQLQQAKGTQAQQIAAQNAARTLQAAVTGGADFKTAAAALKLQVQTEPVFVPAKTSQTDSRLQTLAYVASSLTVGQVVGPIPMQGDNTSLVIHLDSRAKADAAGLAEFEGRFRQRQDEQLRQAASVDWANWQDKKPGTHKPPDLEAFSSSSLE